MADEQNPVPTEGQPQEFDGTIPDDMLAGFDGTIPDDMMAGFEDPEPPPEPVPEHESQAGFWDALKQSFDGVSPVDAALNAARAAADVPGDIVISAAQGAVSAVANAGDNLVDLAVATRLKPKPGDKKGQEANKAFTAWYESHRKRFVDTPELQAILGPQEDGVLGLIKGMSEFATGMAIGGKALGAAGASSRVATVGSGVLADTVFTDTSQERLSNLIQSGPKWLQNPITEYLAADPKDSTAEQKFKAAVEGLLIGGATDVTLGLLKRIKFKGKVPKGAAADGLSAAEGGIVPVDPMDPLAEFHGPQERPVVEPPVASQQATPPPDPLADFHSPQAPNDPLAAQNMTAAEELKTKPKVEPQDPLKDFHGEQSLTTVKPNEAKSVPASIKPKPVEIKKADKGGYQVFIHGQPTGPVVATYNEASSLSATAESIVKNDSIPFGHVPEAELEKFKATGDASDLRINYAQSRVESMAVIDRLSQPDMPVSNPNRATPYKPGKPRTDDPKYQGNHIKAMTDDIGITVDEAKAILGPERLARFGPNVRALQAYVHAQRSNINRLLKAAQASPNNALAWNELGRAMDSLKRVLNISKEATAAERQVADAASVLDKKAAGVAAKAEKPGKPPKPPKAAAEPKAKPEKPAAATAEAKPAEPEVLPTGETTAPPGSPESFQGLTEKEVKALGTALGVAGDDTSAVIGVLKGATEKQVREIAKKDPTLGRKFANFVNGWRFWNMLSGHLTHAGNIAGNTGVMFLRPVEMGLSGLYQGNTLKMRRGWDLMTGLFLHIGDSLKLSKQAFVAGDGILDSAAKSFDSHSFSALNGSPTSWAKGFFSLPGRLLMAEDEFFKQMSYRSKVRADILYEARLQGITDTERIQKMLNEGMQLTFDGEKGMVSKAGLDYARYNTFTTPFSDDEWMSAVQDIHQNHGLISFAAQQVIPFLRTPTRIFEFAWERTPVINMLHTGYRKAMFEGGEKAAEAWAKMTTGTAMYGGAALLAANGLITGAGPSDGALRNTLKSQGWKPYSIHIGDEYIPFTRIGPLGSALATVADYTTISGELKDEEGGQAAAAIITALAARSDDSMFVGALHEFLQAANSNNPDTVKKYLAAYASQFTSPAILNQGNPDNVMREAQGFVDELKKKVPGFSETLEPRLNIFGEPVMKVAGHSGIQMNPFAASTVEDPEIFNEFVELGRGIQMPRTSWDQHRKIDLKDRETYDNGSGKSPYNRLLEIVGGDMGDGKTLREHMRDIIRSDDYRKAPGDDGYRPGGKRWEAIQGLINKRVEKARKKLLAEYPKLRDAANAEKAFTLAGKAGGKDVAEQVKRNVTVDQENAALKALIGNQ